jgi:hypothetical protein
LSQRQEGAATTPCLRIGHGWFPSLLVDIGPANYRPGCPPDSPPNPPLEAIEANLIVNGRPLDRAQHLSPSQNHASEQSPASHPAILAVARPPLAPHIGGVRGRCLPRCFGRVGPERVGPPPGRSPTGLVARLAGGAGAAGTPARRHPGTPARRRAGPPARRAVGLLAEYLDARPAADDLQSRPGRDTVSSARSHNASDGIRPTRKVPGCSGASRSGGSGLNQSIGLP